MKKEKTVLFYQHFGKNTEVRGAHFKTYDFYHHINSYSGYKAVIAFDKASKWNPLIPWYSLFETMPTLEDVTDNLDILFLNSGKDWIKYHQNAIIDASTPIISPVNHFRALNPKHRSFQFLNHPATRLCPSPELFEAVKNHPLTSGKTLYLPNGVSISKKALELKPNKDIDLLIVGNKNPILAQQIFSSFNNKSLNVQIIDEWITKKEFQAQIAKSKISVHLPKAVEAHYIPAIEAMMLESLVIMPDCVGNRSYAEHLKTCYLCDYDLDSFINTINEVLKLQPIQRNTIIQRAQLDSDIYSMEKEREGLLNALNKIG